MTPELWQRIGRVIEQALALEGATRDAFLDRVYRESPELREEVDDLLEAYEADHEFLETPALAGVSFDASTIPSTSIGRYEIVRPLGRGGMGEVFLARRRDGPSNVPVALKVIAASSLDTEFMLIRFQVEQQILSELTHPNIARLLDAGSTDDGRPYFVMEYVDGLPITTYCDRHKLAVDERLRLFVEACQAVQFAHQNFIVHRDLKPSNLLVTTEGVVKLLDFGIAKALDPWKSTVSALETRTGFRVLTPPYASPEQVKGQAVTTASDVYSLGILLYELLTGRRPYELADKLEAEVVRVIAEVPPTRPSEAITQSVDTVLADGTTETVTPDGVGASRQITIERLHRKLRGELDNIVMMALRKEDTRRYNSAAGLGEDIRRHLEGLPVLAQPDTLRYRAGKFVQRHRWGVASTATIALLLLTLSLVTWVQNTRIRGQADAIALERDRAASAAQQADLEAEKSEEIVDILVGLFESANPDNVPGGDTIRVAEFLSRAEAEVLTGLEGRPEIQARMKHVVGEMFYALGDADKALTLLEDGLRQQIALKGTQDVSAADMLHDLAFAYWWTGRRDTAVTLLRTAADRLQQPGDRAKRQRASVLLSLAPLLPLGAHDEKAEMLEEANRLIESVESPDEMQRAAAANQLGVFYYNQGDYVRASEPFRKALDYLEEAVGASHRYYLVTAGNLAGIYQQLGQLEEAEALTTRVLAERRKLPSNEFNDYGVAWSLSQLGVVNLLQGRWREAEARHEEAYSLFSESYGEQHQDAPTFALPYADALVRNAKFSRASGLIETSLQIQRANYGGQSVEYAWALYKKAALLLRQRDYDAALKRIDAAIAIWLKHYPDGQYSSITEARQSRGIVYLIEGRPGDAYEELSAALAYRVQNEAGNPTTLALANLWVGVSLSTLGRYEEAGAHLEAGRLLSDRPQYFFDDELSIVESAVKQAGLTWTWGR